MKKIFQLGFIASLTLGAIEGGDLDNVSLVWKGTSDLKEFSEINMGKFGEVKFKVEIFKDNRKISPKNRVGENTEGSDPVYITTTTDDVGNFAAANIKMLLERVGVDVVDDRPTHTITGEIKELYVRETNRYAGSVIIKYTVRKGDKVVWSGVGLGKSSRWGRSLSYDNHMESISDALSDSLHSFLKMVDLSGKK